MQRKRERRGALEVVSPVVSFVMLVDFLLSRRRQYFLASPLCSAPPGPARPRHPQAFLVHDPAPDPKSGPGAPPQLRPCSFGTNSKQSRLWWPGAAVWDCGVGLRGGTAHSGRITRDRQVAWSVSGRGRGHCWITLCTSSDKDNSVPGWFLHYILWSD